VLALTPALSKFSQNGQRHNRTPEGAGQVASVGVSQGVLATQTFGLKPVLLFLEKPFTICLGKYQNLEAHRVLLRLSSCIESLERFAVLLGSCEPRNV